MAKGIEKHTQNYLECWRACFVTDGWPVMVEAILSFPNRPFPQREYMHAKAPEAIRDSNSNKSEPLRHGIMHKYIAKAIYNKVK